MKYVKGVFIFNLYHVMGIYGILNKINEKIYIGSSNNIQQRWNSHKSYLKNKTHFNNHLQNAWNKYGEENFEFISIEIVVDKSILYDRENFWIAYYKSSDRNFGYNAIATAIIQKGFKMSEDTKRKMSLKRIGKLNPNYGIKMSDEIKQKISSSKMGKKLNLTEKYKIDKCIKQVGECGTNSKLLFNEVVEIKKKYLEGLSLRQLGEIYHTYYTNVLKIVSNKTWRNVIIYNEVGYNILDIIKIIEKIKNNNSINMKIEILTNNKDNEFLKQILEYTYNPYKMYGISEKSFNDDILEKTDYNNIIELLDFVLKNNTGSNFIKNKINGYINNQIYAVKKFYKKILIKDLSIGINIATINKVWNNLIPEFSIQLGTSIEKCKIPKNAWISISHKLNGSRCLFYKGDLYTRSGKKYTGVEHIIYDLQQIILHFTNVHLVFDGELIRKNTDNISDSANFQVGCGIANSKAETKDELKFVIFDIMEDKEFENGKSKFTYQKRKSQLETIRNVISELSLKNLSVVDMFYEGTDQTQIWKWLGYAEEHDLEGVIVNLDAPYECKRTKNLIKVKKFYTLDLEVVGYEEGEGRLKGTLGALVVDFHSNKVNVGSGFDDYSRQLLWEVRDKLIGRVIEVKYKEISKDKKTGLESLQFPIFECMRSFGKEVSYD